VDKIVIEGHEVLRDGAKARPDARVAAIPTFRTLRGWEGEWDDNGSLLISTFTVPSKWPVYLAISVSEGWMASWTVNLAAVAPLAVVPELLDSALDLMGSDLDQLHPRDRPHAQTEALISYGVSASLADFHSDCAKAAVRAAILESAQVQNTLSLYLDVPVNQLKNTGWDFLQGFFPVEVKPKRDTRILEGVRP